MNRDSYRWQSVTAYVDIETGEQIDKTEIGTTFTKVGLIDSTIRIDNAQKAMAEWNSAMAKAEVDQATKNTAIQTMRQNLINMQAEGALKIVGKDLSVAQARMIEREMQWLGYRATTERMSAEAAKKQAENTAEKIIKDYERSGQKLNIDEKNSLREWIYGGIKVLSSFIPGK